MAFSVFLQAEEITREVTEDKNGKLQTTVTFCNEESGLIKKVLIGVGPNYSDAIEFFDNTNNDHLSICYYYSLEYGDPEFPNGKAGSGLVIYQENEPNGIVRSEYSRNGKHLVTRNYYNDNNRECLAEEIIESYDNVLIAKRKIYYDNEKNIDRKKDVSYCYRKGQIVSTTIQYFKNNDFLEQQQYEYEPPIFTQGKSPKRILSFYFSNPSGIIRQESQYDEKGWLATVGYYDKSKTKDQFTRIMCFYEHDILRRKIIYFDETLLKGQIYFISSWYNDDGSIKYAEIYDKDEKKIK